MDQAITGAAGAAPRAVAEFQGYVDGANGLEPSVRWLDRKNMPKVGDRLFAIPPRAAAQRSWSILLTSANHGTVGPVGSTFPHAGEHHERVVVTELVEAGAPPAPGVDLAGLVRFDFSDLDGENEQFGAVAGGAYFLAHEVEARCGAQVTAQAGHDDDADVADLEVRDALGEHYDHEVGEAVSVLRVMAAWKAEAELGEKYKQMAFGVAQAGQVAVPEDRQALVNEALSAARELGDREYAHAHGLGNGGPGVKAKVFAAEKRVLAAINALAAPAQAKPLPAAEVPVPAAPKQCWSLNDEGFSHDSLSELLENYPDLKAGAQVFTGMAVYPALSRLIDSDDVIDQMGDRAYDIAGEYADGYPDMSAEDKAELDSLLEGWIKKACSPDFYEVRDVHTYVITEQDIAAQASTAGGRQEGGAA